MKSGSLERYLNCILIAKSSLIILQMLLFGCILFLFHDTMSFHFSLISLEILLLLKFASFSILSVPSKLLVLVLAFHIRCFPYMFGNL